MATSGENKVLMESGTNEVEIAEFYLGKERFGINVAKIKEFVPYDEANITVVPESPPAMRGVFLLRDQTVPLIDLNKYFKQEQSMASERPVILVTEFNQVVNGFLIDKVNRIHRLSWRDLEPLSPVLAKYNPMVTGSVNVDGHEMLILDAEQIIGDLFPQKMKAFTEYSDLPEKDKAVLEKHAGMKVVLAEDSNTTRQLIIKNLESVGFKHITGFDNGLSAYEYILAIANVKDGVLPDIIISDIEMPQMDGLTFCRKVKKDLSLSVPVIMFSSLITEQMAQKCRKVGADAQISKPEARQMIEEIDRLCL